MRIIGNLLWWLFGGLEAAIGYFRKSGSCMYHHRHSLGKTAFQDGRSFARTIRQGCGVGILK